MTISDETIVGRDVCLEIADLIEEEKLFSIFVKYNLGQVFF